MMILKFQHTARLAINIFGIKKISKLVIAAILTAKTLLRMERMNVENH